MFRNRTVFILGAGSSSEVIFPLGKKLAENVSELVNFRFEGGRRISGDPQLYDQLGTIMKIGELNERMRAGRLIAAGIQLANSIDDFLSIHQADESVVAIGKLGIAKAILMAEQGSNLFPRGDYGAIDFGGLNDTWFAKLISMLSREVPKESLDGIFNNVSFVNFNYDRCLEVFLLRGLEALYAIDRNRAADLVSRLRIFHPYGSVGAIPLHDRREPGAVPFGNFDTNFLEVASRIRTYTERLEETGELKAMRDEIAQADTLVFLGMHFHEQNLKLITPPEGGARRIFGTTYRLSDDDRGLVGRELVNFLGRYARSGALGKANRIRLENQTCSQLFDTYSKSLPQ